MTTRPSNWLLIASLILGGCDDRRGAGLSGSNDPIESQGPKALSVGEPPEYRYTVEIKSIPLDRNGQPLPIPLVKSSIQSALAFWSAVANVSFREAVRPAHPRDSAAALQIVYDHHSTICDRGGYCQGGKLVMYSHTLDCSQQPPVLVPYKVGGNAIVYGVMHEVAHFLGILDKIKEHPPGSPPCIPNYQGPPSPLCSYWLQSYWLERMAAFNPDPNDLYSRPPTYDVHKDVHISIADYNASGNAAAEPNHIGWWGRPDDPDYGQPYYPAKCDVDLVAQNYGVPQDAVPILPMKLCRTWDNTDYHCNESGYVTTDIDAVNQRVRLFQAPSDLRELMGMAWKKNSSSGSRIQYSRYYNSSFHTYFVARKGAVVGPGWVWEEDLGWWESAAGSAGMQIGAINRSRSTIPIYQYYSANKSRAYIARELTAPPAGYSVDLLGYIVPQDDILEPAATVFAPDFSTGNVHRWNGAWSDIPRSAIAVSGSTASNVWYIDRDGRVVEMRYGVAIPHPLPSGKSGLDIAAVGIGKAYATATDTSIYRWTGSGWELMQGLATRIDVAPDGGDTKGIWVISSNGQIWELVQGSGWVRRSGIVGQDIGVGPNGVVYATATDNKIYKWNGTDWSLIAGTATRVDVDPFGHAWVVNPQGQVMQMSIAGGWVLRDGVAAADVAAVSESKASVFAPDRSSGVLHRLDGRWFDLRPTASAVSGSSAANIWFISREGTVMEMLYNGNAIAHPLPSDKRGLDIAVAGIGKVFVTATDTSIYRWSGSTWLQMQGLGTSLDVGTDGSETGGIWIISSNGQIWELVKDIGWVARNGILGQDVGVGANGVVYATTTTNQIYRWTGSSWSQIAGEATRIDVDQFGHAWAVSPQGQLLELSAGGSWLPRAGATVADVAAVVEPEALLFVPDTTNGMMHRWNAGWSDVPQSAIAVSGSSASNVWYIDRDGIVMEMRNGTTVAHPVAGKRGLDIAVAGVGKAFVTTTDTSIYRWSGSDWVQMQGLAKRIDVGPDGSETGGIWAISSNGQIWELVRNIGWVPRSGIVGEDIGVGANGVVYATSTTGKLHKWTGSSWSYVTAGATRVDVDPFGRVWYISSEGEVQQLSFDEYWMPFVRFDIQPADIAAVSP